MTVPYAPSGRLSVPGPGMTLGAATEPIAAVLRASSTHVAAGMAPGGLAAYERLFAPRDGGLALKPNVNPERAAWALIGTWCVGRLRAGRSSLPLDDAEADFFGAQVAGIAQFVPPATRLDVEAALAKLDHVALRELLPYVLDQHGPGTRRSVIKSPDQAQSRSTRRSHGIYYTPADVAEFMVAWVLEGRLSTAVPLLDPACGTGVFLLAAARRLSASLTPAGILERLYGIDRDPFAIDAACFALTALLTEQASKVDPWRLWHLARLNMAERDTLSLTADPEGLWVEGPAPAVASARGALRSQVLSAPVLPGPWHRPQAVESETVRSLFPERHGSCDVVGNPPYAPLGRRPDLDAMPRHFTSLFGSKVTPSTNAFVPFMDFMWSVAGTRGRSSFVVPMSIAYNSTLPFRSLRRAMASVGGEWTFRFFDRTPDALFGDDIKQRVAIVFHDTAAARLNICTSSLTRWTSRQRSGLFASLRTPVTLLDPDISKGIPKIGSAWERDVLRCVRGQRRFLAEMLREADGVSQPDTTLAVGATAYNYLVLYRDGLHKPHGVSARVFTATSPETADFAYGLLASGLAYWLWRVEGDGFHVSESWIQDLPAVSFEPAFKAELARLGRRLWTEAQHNPSVAVNGGRRTVSYRPPDGPIVWEIDRLLAGVLELDKDTPRRLTTYKAETIAVGRMERA